MQNGRIKTFLDDKGFGFITPDGGGADVFFHTSAVQDKAYAVEVGAPVEYEIGTDPKTGKTRATKLVIKGFANGSPASPAAPSVGGGALARLPEICLFKSFYGTDGHLLPTLFVEAPQAAARSFGAAGLKSGQLRQLYQGFQSFAAPLRASHMSFDEARERFGIFYVERVVRQAQRNLIPPPVKELIDAHRELAMQSREEMLGLFRYITSILCYFGDKG